MTNANLPQEWTVCEGSSVMESIADGGDLSVRDRSVCVYKEIPAIPGEDYDFSCGVSSVDYASMTLAFLDSNGDTLIDEGVGIAQNIHATTYSTIMTAPENAATVAVGIYGENGSRFHNCTLLQTNPATTPVDGSVSGVAWVDRDGNNQRGNTDNLLPSTIVSLYFGNEFVAQTKTDLDGRYYFGGLDIGTCYNLRFKPADTSLGPAPAGQDNDVVNNRRVDVCTSPDQANVTSVDAAYLRTTTPMTPSDYVITGQVVVSGGAAGVSASNILVNLINVITGDRYLTSTRADGYYVFNNLPAGDYQIRFSGPQGFEFVAGDASLTAGSSFVDNSGVTPQFNLPASSNTSQNSVSTISNANAVMTALPVSLTPTVAVDDEIEGFVGERLIIDVLANDTPCDGQVSAVNLLGLNVPGAVSVETTSGEGFFSIDNTTQSGVYSFSYGLRGMCGSFDRATVKITLKDRPAPTPSGAPEAPVSCWASIGRLSATSPGVHIDVAHRSDLPAADVPTTVNLYDASMNALLSESFRAPGAYLWPTTVGYRQDRFNYNPLDVRFATFVKDGVESNTTQCIRRPVTPIAMDTDHSGHVGTVTGEFLFDIDADGINEVLAQWFDPADGILITTGFDGPITGEHLFGDQGGQYADGFSKLAERDLNDDGQVSGEELNGLAVWTDKNSNAQVDSGEVTTLASHAIRSLSVSHYQYTARATLNDESTIIMRDVWFGLVPVKQAAR